MRRLTGDPVAPIEAETDAYDGLATEYEALQDRYDAAEDLPDDIDTRLGEIETAMEAYRARPLVFDPNEMARAGAFVSIDPGGHLRIERGFVRAENEAPVDTVQEAEDHHGDQPVGNDAMDLPTADGRDTSDESEEDGVRPLPVRLVAELTAHRTLALRDAVAQNPGLAFRAALHALCLKLFYSYAPDSCLDIDEKSVGFGVQAPGLAESPSALAIEARQERWAARLPKASADLWDALTDLDADDRQVLFAHCVGSTINAVNEAYPRRPGALAHADRLAAATGLDMSTVG